MLREIVMSVLLAASAATATAALKSDMVDYRQGDTDLRGYLVYDDAVTGKRPGVLVIHDWMGEGEYGRMRADMLARLGYVAFALDIYGKDVRPKNAQEAGQQAGKYKSDIPLLRARARAGLDVLRGNERVDPKRMAVIGYCFGGTAALELARSGADVAGAVSFHGTLNTPNPDDARNIKGKVLVLTGAIDPSVPPQQITAFGEEMERAGVDWQLIAYGGAVHSFSKKEAGNNTASGNAYNEKADRRSWQHMKTFFEEVLK